MKYKRILAIETSCDETAAAVVEGTGYRVQSLLREGPSCRCGGTGLVSVLSSVISSQIDIHMVTGGVVPEVAARAHVEAIIPVISEALKQAGITKEEIDVIATTTQPGLRPALVVGETAGRALAASWNKPFMPVHHIAGHIAASWLEGDAKPLLRWHPLEHSLSVLGEPAAPPCQGRNDDASIPDKGGWGWVARNFPAVVLVVSGGHTQLFRLNEELELKLIGQTRDDAAGEAFDKIARLLDLPYPGGPELARLAEKGDPKAFAFPRPMLNSDNLDFSFSGLKTAVRNEIQNPKSKIQKTDLAASAQEAIVDTLVKKTLRAVEQESAGEVIIAGGVAANARLREKMRAALDAEIALRVPALKYCTDNAAMIGAAALLGIKIPKNDQ